MNEPKKRGRPTNAERAAKVSQQSEHDGAAQCYAERVWEGQSPDLTRGERLSRVAAALEAQGMSMEGVIL